MQPIEARVDVPSQAPLTSPAASHQLPFRFSGKADEYFRIWIVNLALTIVTLGVYSAWAKVRSERYFYGNTTVGGTPFEYLADPIKILKGRAIAALLLLAYVGSAQVSPVLNLVVLVLLMLLFPWMLTRSLAFRARYSAWRSIPFGFDGGYGQAFKLYILLPIASVFTLYLAFPWVVRLQTEWMASQHRYGGTRLSFAAETRQFYAIYLLPLVCILGLGRLVGVCGGLVAPRPMGRSSTGWRPISVCIPVSPEAPLVVNVDRGTGGQPQKRGQLTVDRATGEVKKWEPFEAGTPGRRARAWLRFLHTGEAVGLGGQRVAAIASVAMVVSTP